MIELQVAKAINGYQLTEEMIAAGVPCLGLISQNGDMMKINVSISHETVAQQVFNAHVANPDFDTSAIVQQTLMRSAL